MQEQDREEEMGSLGTRVESRREREAKWKRISISICLSLPPPLVRHATHCMRLARERREQGKSGRAKSMYFLTRESCVRESNLRLLIKMNAFSVSRPSVILSSRWSGDRERSCRMSCNICSVTRLKERLRKRVTERKARSETSKAVHSNGTSSQTGGEEPLSRDVDTRLSLSLSRSLVLST